MSSCPIRHCTEQVNRIDTSEPVIWFVLSAWSEEKEWCGTEFGFGEFDPRIFAIVDYGPCFPDEGLEIPTEGWPGPGEGTAFVTTGQTWSGNLQPVYFFAGYAYSEGVIPLSIDPETGFGGTSNCLSSPQAWDTEDYGGMGFFENGIYACPPGEGGGGGFLAFGQQEGACCRDRQCIVTTEEGCRAFGGEFHPDIPTCDPSPCSSGREVDILVVDPTGGIPGSFETIWLAICSSHPGDIIELVDATFVGEGNTELQIPHRLTFRSMSGM